jgi:hypothetical protein
MVMGCGSTDDNLEMLRQVGDSVCWESRKDKMAEAPNRAFRRSAGRIVDCVNAE